ncbi:hypothetical protein ACFTXM_29155 [Streptomyces sp. NPDC056930]|uniref:hypothetical protein n=1 Tax=Streptomyces sp. NPDC056930 TaxID=3345967 RepID=UPI003637805B
MPEPRSRVRRQTRTPAAWTSPPDAPAYGTKLRWSAPKLIAAANERAPGTNVRTLHVLPPAPVKADPAPAAAADHARRDAPRRTATAAPSKYTAKPRHHAGWTRAPRRRWGGRPGRCAS